MNRLDNLPDETLLTMLSFAAPAAIMHFSRTCRRHHLVATDDTVWIPVCLGVIQICQPPEEVSVVNEAYLKTNRDKILYPLTELGLLDKFYALYWHFLSKYAHLLGWWMEGGSYNMAGGIWRIWTSFKQPGCADPRITISGHSVQLKTSIAAPSGSTQSPRVIFNHSRGTIFVTSLGFQAGLTIEGSERILLSQDFDDASFEITIPDIKPRFFSPELGHSDPNATLKLDGEYRPWDGHDLTKLWQVRGLHGSYMEAPFPSPSLLPAVRSLLTCDLPRGPNPTIPRVLMSPTSRPTQLLPLQSPSYSSLLQAEEGSSIPRRVAIEPGLYAAPYNGHGVEIVYAHVRRLEEVDFKLVWEYEGHFGAGEGGPTANEPFQEGDIDRSGGSHLGPFAAANADFTVPLMASVPKVGDRILEVTKVTGDVHVPKGQRTVIGFLDDPIVPSAMRNRLEQLFNCGGEGHEDAGLPAEYPPREPLNPWPILPNADTSSSRPHVTSDPYFDAYTNDGLSPFHEPFAIPTDGLFESNLYPSRGVTIPGAARVAGRGFTDPSWIDSLVHIEANDEFSVWWGGLRCVTIFRRIKDSNL